MIKTITVVLFVLLTAGCTPALYNAAHMGDIGTVKALLDQGTDANEKGGGGLLNDGSALDAASSSGHSDVVKLLLDRGANINKSHGNMGWTALSSAAYQGHTDTVNLLIDRGADINKAIAALDRGVGTKNAIELLKKKRWERAASPPVTPSNPQIVVAARTSHAAQAHLATAGAAIPLRDASSREALSNAIRQVSYSAPQSIAQRLTEFNVLRDAFLDPKTGNITLVGSYDPAYPSGPIPYYDLLADALQNPYPSFSLEYDPGDPAVRRIQQTIDGEMSRVTRDVNYGTAWMKRLMTAALDPRSQSEDRLILEQRLHKLGIPPDVFTAYTAWDGESGLYNTEFRQKMGLFFAKILAGVGIDERVGYGIVALKDWVRAAVDSKQGRAPADGEQPVAKTIRLFKYLGIESDLFRLREEMAAGRLQEPRATTEVLASVYGGLLRGLQVPESEVSSLVERYRAGRIPEQAITDKYNARWSELAKRSLLQNLFNGFRFSGAHLSQMYSLPPVMSGVKLFGSRPDSSVMRVFFDGDYTLKYITSAAATANSVPGNMSFAEYLNTAADRAGASAGRLPVQGANRAWIFPGTVQMDEFSDGSGLRFISANIRISAEPLEEPRGSDSRGTEFYRRALNQYGEQLTSQYDAYARVYPSLHIMRETEKVIALARWIKSRRAPVRVPEAKPARTPVPQRMEGFWGLTYIVRPTGMTDNMYLWVQGGVSFDQQQGDGWMQVTPNVTATNDVLHQLAASTALAEKAAATALGGDLEAARELAEKSAQAMTGQIDRSKLPEPVAAPVSQSGAEMPNAAKQAQVSHAAIAAVEQNVSAMMKAKQDLSKAEALLQTNPQEYARIQEQSQQLQSRSEANLSRLQSLLQKYRGRTTAADEVAVDLRNLDPNKPIVVAPPRPTTKPVSADQACQNWQQQRIRWLAEQEQVQKELEATKNQLRKLNQNILSDIKLYGEWERMADAGMNTCRDVLFNLFMDASTGQLLERYTRLCDLPVVKRYAEMKFPDKAPAVILRLTKTKRLLQDLDAVRSYSALQELAERENETVPEMIDTIRDSLGMLIEVSPLKMTVGLAWKYGSGVIDLLHSFGQAYVSWNGVKQLNQNDAQHRKVLETMTQRMEELVERSQNLKKNLSTSCE